MLVYEYVDNGNLDQWLHGDVGQVSPLTWDIRMNIILGTAKGYDNSNLDLVLYTYAYTCYSSYFFFLSLVICFLLLLL